MELSEMTQDWQNGFLAESSFLLSLPDRDLIYNVQPSKNTQFSFTYVGKQILELKLRIICDVKITIIFVNNAVLIESVFVWENNIRDHTHETQLYENRISLFCPDHPQAYYILRRILFFLTILFNFPIYPS